MHTPSYVDAVRTGEPRALAESQKFPWSPALYPSVLLTGGGCLAAARQALGDGVAGALVSGFHHSHADHGEGFCTFNGLVVTADHLLETRAVSTRRRPRHGPSLRQRHRIARPGATLAVQSVDLRQRLPSEQGVPRRSRAAAHRRRRITVRSRCKTAVVVWRCSPPWSAASICSRAWGRPDLILYQAGADPYREDPYSPLALDHDDLLERDRRAFAFAKAEGIPIAWVLAGGYTEDMSKVVRVHLNTFVAALEVFGS